MKNLEQQFSQRKRQTSKSVRAYSDPIPSDLLIDIFSRVSTKSIARFRCVSKLWASIVRRPDFNELFLSNSYTRPRILFSLKVGEELFVFSSPQPQNPDENSSLVATSYKFFPKGFPSQVCPPLYGLVFHHEWWSPEKPLVICNPLTGQSISLPKLEATTIGKFHFGYDPIQKRFKVLCSILSGNIKSINTHLVLTLETGKCLWRTTTECKPYSDALFKYGEICINGVLYYGAQVEGSFAIVCFDFRSEKFCFTKAHVDWLRRHCWTLINYKGKLGVHQSINFKEEEVVLWVLEDAGTNKWSKLIRVLPCLLEKNKVDGNLKIVGMTSTGEIVLSTYNRSIHFYLVYYNFERNTLRRVNILGFEKFKYRTTQISTFLDYVENMNFL